MHGAHNTCWNAHRTLRKKCICALACAHVQQCRIFFAMEAIANSSWVLCEHRGGCHLLLALAAPPAVSPFFQFLKLILGWELVSVCWCIVSWCIVCGMAMLRCVARCFALYCPCCPLPFSVCVSVCVRVWWSMYIMYAMHRSGHSLVHSTCQPWPLPTSKIRTQDKE